MSNVFHNFINYEIRLITLTVYGIQNDFFACACRSPQAFAFSVFIIGNNSVCTVKNILGRAVILLKPDNLCIFILLLERQNIFNRCAPETVNALVIITYNAYVFIAACKQGNKYWACEVS